MLVVLEGKVNAMDEIHRIGDAATDAMHVFTLHLGL